MPTDKKNVRQTPGRSGMKAMEWMAALSQSKVNSYDTTSGVTFSIEPKESDQKIETLELEVLKSILNREAYLTRLKAMSRTVSRKFKPEIADLIDLIRAATLDVLESIVVWREAKDDHAAVFTWSGTNYLLKLSSDLDYLAEYYAIRRWAGFALNRNPFCVANSMETGSKMFSVERILDVQSGSRFEGEDRYCIGGLSVDDIRYYYECEVKTEGGHKIGNNIVLTSPDDPRSSSTRGEVDAAVDAAVAMASTQRGYDSHNSHHSRTNSHGSHSALPVADSRTFDAASSSSSYRPDISSYSLSNTNKEYTNTVAGVFIPAKQKKVTVAAQTADKASYALAISGEMRKVRQAEMVILKEEERFGKFSRDAEGRLVPVIIAKTRRLAVELSKDDKRPTDERANTSSTYASHAVPSGMGVLEEEELQALEDARNSMAGNEEEEVEEDSSVLKRTDFESDSRVRGQDKVGGMLAPIETKAAESRARRPIRPNLSGDMESSRLRKKLKLIEKIADIEVLRRAVVAQREALALFDNESMHSSSTHTRKNRSQHPHVAHRKVEFSSTLPSQSRSLLSNSKSSDSNDNIDHNNQGNRRDGRDDRNPRYNPHPDPQAVMRATIGRTGAGQGMGQYMGQGGGQCGQGVMRSPRLLDDAIAAGRAQSAAPLHTNTTYSPSSSSATSPVNKRSHLLSVDDSATLPSTDRLTDRHPAAIGRILSDEEIALRAKESSLNEETNKIIQHLNHIERFDAEFFALKREERRRHTVDKAWELERKRRLLTNKEGKSTGPPPPDKPDVYDFFATRIQAIARGYNKRSRLTYNEDHKHEAATSIQKIVRGGLARFKSTRHGEATAAAVAIQRIIRGYFVRNSGEAWANDKEMRSAVLLVQRIWRGYYAKYRVLKKKALDQVNSSALIAVDPRNLYISDVKELGSRIQRAVESDCTTSQSPLLTGAEALPSSASSDATSYPPDEVLHLVRLAVMIIQTVEAPSLLGVSDYSLSKKRTTQEVDGQNLSWSQAFKVLNRSERFMRLLMYVAQGPTSKPPRMVHIPSAVILLFNAQLMNPRWCLETFGTIGRGARLCVQLFRFVRGMVDIAAKQQPFIDLFPATFPDWLPRLYELQRIVRQCERVIVFTSRYMAALLETVQVSADDQWLTAILEKDYVDLRKRITIEQGNMKRAMQEEDTLREKESAAEALALESMNFKLIEMNDELKRTSDELKRLQHHRSKVPGEGESALAKLMAETRYKLLVQNLLLEQFINQIRLATLTSKVNGNYRREYHRLSPDVRLTASNAGEATALSTIAAAKRIVMLKSVGLTSPSQLPEDLMGVYRVVEATEIRLKRQAELRNGDTDDVSTDYEKKCAAVLNTMEMADIQGDLRRASDHELEEERVEDEIEAKRDRARLTQYIPDELLNPPSSKTRLNPMVIAIARDVSAFGRRKLHGELTRLLPGLFITLDVDAPYGIDSVAMQTVLDSQCSIIMPVDAGLTRLSRASFLTRLELAVKSLYPVPSVVLALGDESNRAGFDGEYSFGVHSLDLKIMKDGDIKASLESNAKVLHEMLTVRAVHSRMQSLSTEVWPPNAELTVVMEALYILQAHPDNDSFLSQDRMRTENLSAVSWRLTSQLLAEPTQLGSLLKAMRRGAYSLLRLECLLDYTLRPEWPVRGGNSRQGDRVLHLVASYVEDWMSCERKTLDRGGVPLALLTRGAMKVLQTVVWVGDSPALDPEGLDAAAVVGKTDYGWKVPAVRLVRATLQDMRVLKTVSKIAGEMYNVTVYRDRNLLYFDAYDPSSSKVYMTTMQASDICSMLVPNSDARSISDNIHSAPPKTEMELYGRLVKLLRFQKTSKTKAHNAGRELTCHREYSLLQTFNCKLGGHYVQLKCYEAGQGELFLTAFVFEFSAIVFVLVTEAIRAALLEDCDPNLEQTMIQDGDARQLMLLVRDRLLLWPRKSAFGTGLFTVNSAINMRQTATSSADISKIKRTQGFKLGVLTRGGAGRTLLTKVVEFNTVPHIIKIKSSTTARLLRVCVYEPRKRHSMEVRLVRFLRRVLLGTENDDAKHWCDVLVKRLRVSWRGEPYLTLDTRVCHIVKRVDGRRMVLSLDAVDENSMILTLADTVIGATFEAILSKRDTMGLMSYEPPLETYSRQLEEPKGMDTAMRAVMQGMAVDKSVKIVTPLKVKKEKVDKAKGKTKKPLRPASRPGSQSGTRPSSQPATRSPSRPGSQSASRPASRALTPGALATLGGVGSAREMDEGSGMSETMSENGSMMSAESLTSILGYDPGEVEYSEPANASADDLSLLDLALDKAKLSTILVRLSVLLKRIDKNSIFAGYHCNIEASDTLAVALRVQLLPKVRESNMSAMDLSIRYLPRLHKIENRRLDPFIPFVPPSNGENSLVVVGAQDIYCEVTPVIIQFTRVQAPVLVMDAELDILLMNGSGAVMAAYEARRKASHLLALKALGAPRPQSGRAIKDGGESGLLADGGENSEMVLVEDGEGLIFEDEDGKEGEDDWEQDVEIEETPTPCKPTRGLNFPSRAPKEYRLGKKEILVHEFGSKVSFRDERTIWQSHAAIKVYETNCWTVSQGKGKRLRFVVFEPLRSKCYEGLILDNTHLRRVLGSKARDLRARDKQREMLLYICRHRMYLTKNILAVEDAEPSDEFPAILPENIPGEYHVDFVAEIIYSSDKVTPINLGAAGDDKVNESKLFEAEQTRGVKIFRTAKRVSGQLLTLIVFEVEQPIPVIPVLEIEDTPAESSIVVREREESGDNADKADGTEGVAEGGDVVALCDPFTAQAQEQEEEKKEEDDDDYEYETESEPDETDTSVMLSGVNIPPVPVYDAPVFRIVAYDPKSRRKLVFTVPKEALLEISGGQHSQYLAPDRRRELASVLCDSLLCVFPRGLPYEIIVPWSGADAEAMAAASVGNKTIGEKMVMNDRTGKLFRAGMRVSDLDLIVTVYASTAPPPVLGAGEVLADSTAHADGSSSMGQDNLEAPLTLSFYRALSSETVDIFVTRQQQLDRLGVTVTSVPDGMPRAAAIRRLCRFFKATLVHPPVVIVSVGPMTEDQLTVRNERDERDEEVDDDEVARRRALALTVTGTTVGSGSRVQKKRSIVPKAKCTLCVELLPSGKDFVADYKLVKIAPVNEERPVGLPAAFIPLDVIGELLVRRVLGLVCKPYLGAVDSVPPRAGNITGNITARSGTSSGDTTSREKVMVSGSRKGGHSEKSTTSLTGEKKRKRRLKAKNKEYQVSIYAKAPTTSPAMIEGDYEKGSTGEAMVNGAKGLVVKLYDQDKAETLTLHIAASELNRICVSHGAALLLGDMNGVKAESDLRPPLAPLAKGLQTMLKVDELQARMSKLTNRLVDFVLSELAVNTDPLGKPVPFLEGSARGVPPR